MRKLSTRIGLAAASVSAFGLLLLVCACKPAAETPERGAAEVPAQAAENLSAADLGANARRLAGLDEAGGSDDDAAWREHRRAMKPMWEALDERHLRPMRAWGARVLGGAGDPQATLFYPFSGPDILSALQFFPEASRYVLVGLEPPGRVPDLAALEGAERAAELGRLRESLGHLVAHGYFVTKEMERDFGSGTHRLDGLLPALLALLAKGGQVPAAVRFVTLDETGKLQPSSAASEAEAVEIRFRAAGDPAAPERRLYYFAQDLSDDGLRAAPGLPRFLERGGGFNAFLKSASYLLHTPEFSAVRNLILGGRTILQDDSGVPLRAFDRGRFALRFFGKYERTLPAFREWFQEDLRAIYAAPPAPEPLDFAIGYHTQIGGSCLILAERLPRDPGWPQFCGPGGQGDAREAKLPLEWGEGKNVAWKTPIPGCGWSSPVIAGGKVWLTTAREAERTLAAVAVDLESGAILRQIDLFQPESWRHSHAENSFASPTPVAEAGKVWFHFGGYGTACLDAETGQVLWRRDPFAHDHEHGPGSSPILYGDLLIAHFDGADERFVAAFDKRTGDLAWRAERSADVARRRYAFSTPLVIDHDGAPQLISPASGQVSAYDPLTGEEIWRVRHDGYSAVPRPVAGFGRVFAITGYIKPHLLAIDPGGRGDVTDTRVAWVSHDRVPANPSPLLVGDRLFLITDFGIASWVDADTGESLWCERLGGRHYASPLHAQGRIYTFDTDGTTHVLAAADAFRELAANRLDGGIRASPAVAGETLILRTDTHLYRIGQSGGSEGQ